MNFINYEKKQEIMTALTAGTIAEQRKIVEGLGLKNCYKNGNKAVVDIAKVEEMLKTEKDVDFVASIPSNWLNQLQHCKTAEERWAAIELLSVKTYGKMFTQQLVKTYAKKNGLTVAKPTELAYTLMSATLGVSMSEAIIAKAGTVPTALIRNIVKNIADKVTASSSKKIKAMDIKIIDNPTKAQMKALGVSYTGTNKRPDMVICYTVGGERKVAFYEHFGWEGSDCYNRAQTAKLAMAANEGYAFFASFGKASDKHVDVTDLTKETSSVFGRVLNWNADNTFVGGATPIENIYAAIAATMNYIGAPTMMPKFEKAFIK